MHVSHILRKLGAPNRREAAAIAHRLSPPRVLTAITARGQRPEPSQQSQGDPSERHGQWIGRALTKPFASARGSLAALGNATSPSPKTFPVPTGAGPHIMACLHNLAIGVLSRRAVNLAAALRYHARDPARPVTTLG